MSAIQTFGGRRFDPTAPDSETIDTGDIAHALAQLCRFGGHCAPFYSVAQHSCVVADAVGAAGGTTEVVRAALLHDASEAYLGDLPHPLKHRTELGELYRRIEEPLQATIMRRFGLSPTVPELVKRIDRAALAAERIAFMRPSDDGWWPELDGVPPLAVALEAWPPERAEAELLRRFAAEGLA